MRQKDTSTWQQALQGKTKFMYLYFHLQNPLSQQYAANALTTLPTRQAKSLLLMKNAEPRTVIYTTQGVWNGGEIHLIVIFGRSVSKLCNEDISIHIINTNMKVNTSTFRSEFLLIIHIKSIKECKYCYCYQLLRESNSRTVHVLSCH